MSKLQDSLHRLLSVDGVRTAAVIDVATGMIVRSVGKPDPDFPVTAACVADEARAVRQTLAGATSSAALAGDEADAVVEITTLTGSRLQLARVLQDHPGQGLLLFVDVDRDKSTVGLAALRMSKLAPLVLA